MSATVPAGRARLGIHVVQEFTAADAAGLEVEVLATVRMHVGGRAGKHSRSNSNNSSDRCQTDSSSGNSSVDNSTSSSSCNMFHSRCVRTSRQQCVLLCSHSTAACCSAAVAACCQLLTSRNILSSDQQFVRLVAEVGYLREMFLSVHPLHSLSLCWS